MKKITGLIVGLMLSHNVFALDSAVENIQALCGLAKQGKYSQIQSKAQLQADGSVKLASVSGKGEISFSKGDWEGFQQILWAHQAGSAKDYYACVKDSLPYFKSKVTAVKTATPAASSKKVTAAKTVKAPKTSAPKPPQAEPDVEVNVETHGDKSPAIQGDGATVNYSN